MKVLQTHNYYRSSAPSGENNVVDAERELLIASGVSVETFFRRSDSLQDAGLLGTVLGAATTPWNPCTKSSINPVIDRFKPDIVHVHNTFPTISPSVFHAVRGKAARVLTLHNYRIVCPNAVPVRAGKICTQCIDRRSVVPALKYGCYRGKRIATVPLAAGVVLHRAIGTWRKEVDAFIVLSDFQKEIMARSGIPEFLIHVKPNFMPGSPAVVPWGQRRNEVVFVGRLTAEKGVQTLVAAWRLWGSNAPPLRVIGDGPLRDELISLAEGLNITFVGQVTQQEASSEIGRSKALIVPSEWFEGFPMVIQEAFAKGTPVFVSRVGPLPGLIEHGAAGDIFEPGKPESLVQVFKSSWEKTQGLQEQGMLARKLYETHYDEQTNLRQLLKVYGAAIDVHRSRCV